MSWVTPRTWTIGQLVTASDMNEQVRDNLAHLKIPIDDDGKIAALSAAYLGDLSGDELEDVLHTNVDNDVTAGVQNFNGGSGTRLILPTGSDKWAT